MIPQIERKRQTYKSEKIGLSIDCRNTLCLG